SAAGLASHICKLRTLERALERSSPKLRPPAHAALLRATMRWPPLPGATSTSDCAGSSTGLIRPSPGDAEACALSRRAIGHAFNQTETMRDMIPFDKPRSGTAMATALEA